MTGTIETLVPIPATPSTASLSKDSSAPSDTPDLRQTQAGVQAAAKAAHTDTPSKPKNGPETDLEDAINERLAKLLGSNIQVSVEVDKDTGDFVYKSVDKKTGEVRRQYPTEEVLRMLAFFHELDGLLYDNKA